MNFDLSKYIDIDECIKAKNEVLLDVILNSLPKNRRTSFDPDIHLEHLFYTSIRTKILRSKDDKMIEVLAKYDSLNSYDKYSDSSRNKEDESNTKKSEKKSFLKRLTGLNKMEILSKNNYEVTKPKKNIELRAKIEQQEKEYADSYAYAKAKAKVKAKAKEEEIDSDNIVYNIKEVEV